MKRAQFVTNEHSLGCSSSCRAAVKQTQMRLFSRFEESVVKIDRQMMCRRCFKDIDLVDVIDDMYWTDSVCFLFVVI